MTTTDTIQNASAGDTGQGQGAETPSYDDINTPVVVLVGAIAALLTLLAVMFVQGMYYHWNNSYLKVTTTEPVSQTSNDQIAAQRSLLHSGEGGVAIEDAMRAVVKKYQR